MYSADIPPAGVVNSEALLAAFGFWPSFHDAEVHSAILDRGNALEPPSITLVVYAFSCDRDVDENGFFRIATSVLVTLKCSDVRASELVDLGHQNVLASMGFESNGGRPSPSDARTMLRTVRVDCVQPSSDRVRNAVAIFGATELSGLLKSDFQRAPCVRCLVVTVSSGCLLSPHGWVPQTSWEQGAHADQVVRRRGEGKIRFHAGRRASGFRQVSLSNVPRRRRPAIRPTSRAAALSMNASALSGAIRGWARIGLTVDSIGVRRGKFGPALRLGQLQPNIV